MIIASMRCLWFCFYFGFALSSSGTFDSSRRSLTWLFSNETSVCSEWFRLRAARGKMTGSRKIQNCLHFESWALCRVHSIVYIKHFMQANSVENRTIRLIRCVSSQKKMQSPFSQFPSDSIATIHQITRATRSETLSEFNRGMNLFSVTTRNINRIY